MAYRFLRFGPEVAYRATRPRAYIALADALTRKHLGTDMLIGGEHDSLESFEAEIEQLRRDLDEVLCEAKDYFSGKQTAG